MAKIDLDVPAALKDLPDEERDLLLRRALRSATRERIEQVERELSECTEKIEHFVKKYSMNFDTFEKKVESRECQGVDIQEDYHDWYFWHKWGWFRERSQVFQPSSPNPLSRKQERGSPGQICYPDTEEIEPCP